ncbi:MAG: heavy-metal-associated domain-containing protein [Anaerolineae bacterium]|nr:heavy-metal-associated domain-containing protein [Anaerolineae bacterium]
MAKITLHVPNISCHHCVMTIQRGLQPVEGVSQVEGDVEAKTVTLEYRDEETLARAKQVLAEIGYPVAE